ncbi:MAG: cytochrome C554 [Chlorobi bacterium]|nr:cytochrome C554 [Chlorobiota bacterium]
MKSKMIFPVISMIFLFVFASMISVVAQEHHYVGVKKCGMCHKKAKDGEQLKIWEGSKHSKAYETLKTAEADKIAMEKYGKKAVETDECLKCHVTGHGADAALFEKSFKIENGVQCESCHGPGKDYKSKKVMKDQAKAIEKGLILYSDEAAIEKLCRTCHNEKSPSFKEFNFKEMWAKIKHNIPEKK